MSRNIIILINWKSPLKFGDFFWLMLTLHSGLLFAQYPSDSVPSKNIRLIGLRPHQLEIGFGAAALGGLAGTWYAEGMTHFRFFNDGAEWGGMDKLGHFVTAHKIVQMNSLILREFHYQESDAFRKSFWLAEGFLLGVEVLDGFSKGYGASVYDLGANLLGGGSALLLHKYKLDHLLQFKFSYRRSGYAEYRPSLLGKNAAERWLKDYNGQIYWLSIFPGHLFDSRFFKCVGVSMGYGIDGYTGARANISGSYFKRRSEYYLSGDIDLGELFHFGKSGRYFDWISFLKIPMPGVRFGQGTSPNWGWR